MKLHIRLDVPSIASVFELLVPKELDIRQLTALIIKGVEELSNYNYISSGTEFLCAEAFDMPLNEQMTLEDYGVENGDRLILI